MDYGLRDWARRQPDRIAIEFESGETVSYAALEAMANRFAHLFRSRNLVAGDHVCGILPNGAEIIAAIWGAYRCGLYFVPVANTFSAAELAYVVKNSDSKLVVTSSKFADKLTEIEAKCDAARHRLIFGTRAGWDDCQAVLDAQPITPIADERPGLLMMYSSGTTGAPKGIWRPLPDPVEFSEGPPMIARDMMKMFQFTEDTRYLSPAPLYHAAPLRATLSVIASGGSAVIMMRFDAERALHLLETRNITHSQWVPTMFRRMLALPEDRRMAFSAPAHVAAWHAAAPCPPDLKRAMIDWWGPIIDEYYAASESIGTTVIKALDWLEHPGSVGRVRKGIPHILDSEWNELPTGTPGALYFETPSPFTYYNEPEKTAAKTSPQGWQTLGDVGYLDAEGYLYLTDRQDDMIISGGVNIYPQELEQAIEALPQVLECCVAPLPDHDLGERPVAFVSLAPGAARGEETRDLIAVHCQSALGRTKQPYQIRIIDDIPKSDAGKPLRRILKQKLATESADSMAV